MGSRVNGIKKKKKYRHKNEQKKGGISKTQRTNG